METTVVLFIMNGLLGITMYFMKIAHDLTKGRLDKIEMELLDGRKEFYRKDEFHDFRDQLWRRLDAMESQLRVMK